MTTDHARFAQWDSAYVLGALSPSERSEYEEHLATCTECRRAVAELTPMPGLLARLSGDRANALLEDPDAATLSPPTDMVDRIRQQQKVRRTRRIWVWTAATAASVAALILLATIIVPLTLGRPADAQSFALESLTEAPISATVTLTPVGWGTRIDLSCTYEGEAADAPEQGWPYALYITDDNGKLSEVSSWRASPGETARLEAGTAIDLDDIAAVEIRPVDSDRTLMRGVPED
ncbi:anti-sigma factor [Diaminobutyricimonas sp. LJ205]|uniref:anti-sigma factor family protein n=1 Tax=Diaminobutyricimonas sp. LJ205 TaxID=2683590 RepID=UPI0012F4F148|nr:zf-HC2 domain-containing protein [Diaminobutyricimonas sp. LJ205]